MLRLITLEEHFTAQEIIDENNRFKQAVKPADPELDRFYQSMVLIGESLTDIEKLRLPFMDQNRIDMQVLSYTSPVADTVPAAEAVRICRRANDILAARIREHPERFAGFATLPFADPQAAADELERCVKEYHFCGALVAGQFQEHFYDEAVFLPIFARAAQLDVPIHFHPALIHHRIQEYYFRSENWSSVLTGQLSGAGLGWHIDVGIHIVRMILSGIFDKLPNLKLISGHWGELMPSFLERMDSIMTRKVTGLRKDLSEYYKEHIYVTPSGILSKMQLEYMVKLMGADHIMYALDYPYIKPEDVYEFLADADLTPAEKELIAHGNAERLLHLNG